MALKEVLEERLEELDMTKYELSKRIAENRGKSKATDVSSIVAKVLDSPEGRRYSNVIEVIEALEGKVIIEWRSVKRITV